MKKKLSERQLSELRRREASRKEMEYRLQRDLKIEDERLKTEELFYKDKNRFVIGFINFAFTIIFGSMFKFALSMFVPFAGLLNPALNVLIWGAAIISAFLKKSLIERLFNRINP